ncbi:DNA lyase [Rhizobium lentis]|uniref:8-oxoguanine DNA glycosylase n=1 Tax=Rhizobium lentis TaxID=1138194 RepID=UPI001C840557|nr:DNA lyase [Rhizobium lentis]
MREAGQDLERAVVAIYPEIAGRAYATAGDLCERSLWRELSCCVLSSQVPYAVAVAAAEAIDRQGLLHLSFDGDLTHELTTVLKTPLAVGGSLRNYRFPASRARQLSSTKRAVCAASGSLRNLLDGDTDPVALRSWLVNNAPGLGPKQASMFLRNSGVTYSLAVLDRHVLDFMKEMGLYSGPSNHISGLSAYGRYESDLRSYAERLGAAVGLLDWAIWIVMRVFKGARKEIAA